MPKLEQKSLSADSVERLGIINKAGMNSSKLSVVDVFVDTGSQTKNMITSLCLFAKSKLIVCVWIA